jgi:alpha-tubulin suppressor-like RCC1 family protein
MRSKTAQPPPPSYHDVQPPIVCFQVVGVAASRHTLLVTRSGSVWSMGANDSSGGGGHGSKALLASGQLGRSGGWGPGQVLGPLQYFKVTQVAAGRYHSVALAEGKVYTWGLNDQGQLGRPAGAVLGEGSNGLAAAALSQGQDHKDDRLPHLKRTLHGASGDSTTAAAAAVGQAGQPRSSDASGTVLPHAAETDTQPRKQTLSVAGSGPGSSSGECFSGWSCHDGDPALVEALEGTTVVAVKAGRYSTVVLDASRQLWVWGYDGCASQGQLPLQDEAWRPRRVQGELSGKWVVAFDVGE